MGGLLLVITGGAWGAGFSYGSGMPLRNGVPALPSGTLAVSGCGGRRATRVRA